MASELMKAMRELKDKEGIPVAVQIDWAVREWLKKRGVTIKTERPRVSPRKRS